MKFLASVLVGLFFLVSFSSAGQVAKSFQIPSSVDFQQFSPYSAEEVQAIAANLYEETVDILQEIPPVCTQMQQREVSWDGCAMKVSLTHCRAAVEAGEAQDSFKAAIQDEKTGLIVQSGNQPCTISAIKSAASQFFALRPLCLSVNSTEESLKDFLLSPQSAPAAPATPEIPEGLCIKLYSTRKQVFNCSDYLAAKSCLSIFHIRYKLELTDSDGIYADSGEQKGWHVAAWYLAWNYLIQWPQCIFGPKHNKTEEFMVFN